MIKIFSYNIEKTMQQENFDELRKNLTVKRIKKIDQYKFNIDSHRALISEVLMRNLAGEFLNLPGREVIIDRDKFGKPFLVDYNHLYINSSHSNNWVIGALSDTPIGIDIEEIRPINLDIVLDFFTPNELLNFFKVDSELRTEYFYKIWTAKEAYTKCIGTGFSTDLRSFSINHNKVILKTSDCYKNLLSPYSITYGTLDDYHIMAVCQKSKHYSINHIHKNEMDIYKAFFRKEVS